MLTIAVFAVLIAVIILLFIAAILPSSRKEKPVYPEHFAHRGLHNAELPENSLAAFSNAIDNRVGFEFDIHLSADKIPVVFHDNNLKRITGIDRNISDLSLKELKELRLCGTDERIPTLSETLSLVSGRVPLLIELKQSKNNRELCEEVFKQLDNYKGEFIIESFDSRILKWVRTNRPNIIRGQLASKNSAKNRPPFSFLLSQLCLNFLSRPDFIAYNLNRRNVPALFIINKLLGKKLYIWTVKDETKLKELEAADIGTIFEGFIPDAASSKKASQSEPKNTSQSDDTAI